VHRNIGVLISGRGSNLQAIIDAIRDGRLDARLAIVISNRADAYGLERAREADVDTLVRDHKAWPSREAYEAVLVEDLRARNVDLVCLAGFMRLLGATFVSAFPNRILNIHPALLPSFPGLHAQRQAVEHGVKMSGATVHFVTTDLDAGPIVLQASVPVLDTDTEDTLSARILEAEHRIYPEAIQRVLDGRWTLEGRRVVFEP
jgi:phosphoribosylglycinamide formyltransferase-1